MKITIGGERFSFSSLKDLLAKATPLRSGDQLAGIAANSEREAIAAKLILADLPLKKFLQEPVIPYETDEVTRLIFDGHDLAAFAPISHWTVGELRDQLLQAESPHQWSSALIPEMVAAVSKIMRNQDLIAVAKKISVITRFRNTLGLPGHLGVRLQPNHPTDDVQGIFASMIDGLLYGCGDAVIGINPATDSLPTLNKLLCVLDDFRQKYQIPTQTCVLSHVTNQMEVMAKGAPLDLVFQSIGGTEATNKSFGINLKMLDEAHQMALALKRGVIGDDVMYFETGQGSSLSANAHHGVDQQTIECRAYAVAKKFRPLLVNSVVGFIGPEYLFNGKQILRAGLEDHFCGKLLGLPMGVDICYTNHAEADQDDMDTLLTCLGVAGCNYIMGVPGADDIMLSYQSTSFHDALFIRQTLGLSPAPEFTEWLVKQGIFDANHVLQSASNTRLLLSSKEDIKSGTL